MVQMSLRLHYWTRMYCSRMRTICCRSCLPRGVSTQGCLPRECLPRGVCLGGVCQGSVCLGGACLEGCLSRGWTESQTGVKHYLATTTLQTVMTFRIITSSFSKSVCLNGVYTARHQTPRQRLRPTKITWIELYGDVHTAQRQSPTQISIGFCTYFIGICIGLGVGQYEWTITEI